MASSSSSSSSSPYFSLFLRAYGFKPGFRRTGPSRLFNIFVAAGVGVVSGHYIFAKPLEDHWAEQHRLQQQQQSAEGKTGGGAAAAAAETTAASIAGAASASGAKNAKSDSLVRK